MLKIDEMKNILNLASACVTSYMHMRKIPLHENVSDLKVTVVRCMEKT